LHKKYGRARLTAVGLYCTKAKPPSATELRGIFLKSEIAIMETGNWKRMIQKLESLFPIPSAKFLSEFHSLHTSRTKIPRVSTLRVTIPARFFENRVRNLGIWERDKMTLGLSSRTRNACGDPEKSNHEYKHYSSPDDHELCSRHDRKTDCRAFGSQ
jgi:hypothetical protein